MKTETRYNIGDEVFLIKDNKIVKKTINRISIFIDEKEVCVGYRFEDESMFSEMTYEKNIFPSREALLEYIQSE